MFNRSHLGIINYKLATISGLMLFLIACSEQDEVVIDSNNFYEQSDNDDDIDIGPIKTWGLSEDISAYKTVVNIIRETGLGQNFVIIPGEVDEVVSYVKDNERIMSYNPDFMEQLKEDTNWRGISVLARQIGHHLGNHELKDGVPTPEEIIEADKYAGFVLQKMGATLEESIAALEQVINEDNNSFEISKNNRISSLVKGFNDAKILTSDTSLVAQIPERVNQESTSVNESAAISNSQRKKPDYIYRVFLALDTSFYYIDDYDVVYSEKNNISRVVGEKKPSTKPGFDWIFIKEKLSYGVDLKGRLWAFSTDGNFHIVGQAVKINMKE